MKGRGHTTHADVVAGVLLFSICLLAVLCGLVNLYLIRRMKVFHNAFGCLAASRTFGEMCCNLVHVLFTAPVTVIQPSLFSSTAGVTIFMVERFFGFSSCIVQLAISVNRFVAVCLPLRYKFIFTKQMVIFCIAISWIFAGALIVGYATIPCNLIAYNPQNYNYAPLFCPNPAEKPPFIFGMVSTRVCFGACLLTLILDVVTFFRILRLKNGAVDKDSGRNIRFFFQSFVQNLAMMAAMALVCFFQGDRIVNATVNSIVAFDVYYVAHICNALTLVVLTPEVRKKLSTWFSFKKTLTTKVVNVQSESRSDWNPSVSIRSLAKSAK
ncbi:hypothetical protein QR680_016884 [Steinernema hermaphroditum]|uniref:G-protein coupled receptors family 1 profile domain-containing protein n=1 Tax=Steinernema hermaphroditum TaxID=289476 RepID=A0AA39HF16_9BILA|nr:hypothetical protein QR680_016884 [Steinernema hermaphroditum]